MSGILRLESLTKGNTLKQGDKTPLKYRLFDADGEKLNIAGKTAKVRLVYPDFLTIGYEKDGLTVAQDDTVTFTIDGVIPSRIYHVEIIVDDKFIFPSRADEAKFTVDKSSLGTESNIIEIIGVDAVVRKAVDLITDDPSLIIDENKIANDIIENTGIGSISEQYPQLESEVTLSRGEYTTLNERLDNNLKNIKLNNLFKNSDFANGTTDWTILGTSTPVVEDGVVTFTPTARYGRLIQTVDFNLGDIFYLFAEVKSTSTTVGLAASTVMLESHSGSGEFERLSTRATWVTGYIGFRVQDNASSGWSEVSVKNPMVFNLTQIFGSGHEPNLEHMDELISKLTHVKDKYVLSQADILLMAGGVSESDWDGKQDKLVAGEGINIEGNVISANLPNPDEKPEEIVTVTNIAKNPTMESNAYWGGALINTVAVDGTIEATATGANGNVQHAIVEQGEAGHKYYVSFDIKATSKDIGLMVYEYTSPPTNITKKLTKINEFERVSTIYSPQDSGFRLQARIADFRTSGWDTFIIDNPVITDLTADFGAGKEPTIEEYEAMLGDDTGSIFFTGSKNITITKNIETKPLYVRVADEVLEVIYKYGNQYMLTRLGKKGVNQIFDFRQFYKVDSPTEFNYSNLFYNNSSDWFGPHRIKAVANVDGDNVVDSHFVGGNHGYDNSGTIAGNTATGRTASLNYFIDGDQVTNFEGYTDKLEIRWENLIQAINTKKADGSGREVLKEQYHMTFDGESWKVRNDITPLEDLTSLQYYGLQMQFGAWDNKFRFIGGGNRSLNNAGTAMNSGSKSTTAMQLYNSIGDTAEFGVYRYFDIGDGELNASSYNALTTATKLYTLLISGEQPLAKDSIYSFEGYYKFYKQ